MSYESEYRKIKVLISGIEDMSDYTETTTRADHLRWCKERAFEYLDKGEWGGAWISFRLDMAKHGRTRDHIALEIGDQLVGRFLVDIADKRVMPNSFYSIEIRRFIEGFN